MLIIPKVKCLYCEEIFDRDKVECLKIGRRYVHKTCYEKKEKEKTKEQKDLEQLNNYILKLFSLTTIPQKIKRQIKEYVEQYQYSYSGIYKSLYWFYEIKGNSLEKANGGIGIVPYIYKEAYNYFYEIHKAQQINEKKNAKEYIKKCKQITINSPQSKYKVKLFKI